MGEDWAPETAAMRAYSGSTLLTLWFSIQHCLKLFVLLFCSVMYLKFSMKRILNSLTVPSSLFSPSVLAHTSTDSEAACLRKPAFLSVGSITRGYDAS